MLIGISGTLGSGKTEVARYLIFQGFKLLVLEDEGAVDERVKLLDLSSDTPTVNGTKSGHKSASNGSVLNADSALKETEAHRTFSSFDDLLEYVTLNWREHFVLLHVAHSAQLQILQKRPFFLHVWVDAPIHTRYARYVAKNGGSLSLAAFVSLSDEELYNPERPLVEINTHADVKIVNTSTSIKALYIKLSELNLLDGLRLRPTWDSYFMQLADLAALRSNCMKRRVGCVLVRDNRVVATGYNGTPRHLTNCNEGGCPRCNKGQGSGAGLSTCLCLHAEENALLEAGRDRIGLTGKCILYCNTCPCLTCSVKIVQSGINEVVFAQSYSMDEMSHKVMSEAKIVLRQFLAPPGGVFI